MATSSKRRRAVGIGVLLMIIGVVVAVALWFAGSARRSNAIENFARAPVGCDTTLDFAEAGTYLLFVESSGRLDEVRGDCDAPDRYELDDEPSSVEITLVDPDGEVVDLDGDPPSISYSSGDFAGAARFEVEIADATDHVIRVESASGDSFAVAVGRDPDDGVALLRALAIGLGLLGLVGGLVVALAVGRRSGPSGDGWSPAQPGASPWGAPPPTQPLYRPPPAPPGGPLYPGASVPGQPPLSPGSGGGWQAPPPPPPPSVPSGGEQAPRDPFAPPPPPVTPTDGNG